MQQQEDQQYILYSPTEASIFGAGFWSAEDGWATFDQASQYAAHLRQVLPFPKCPGRDAGWVQVGSPLHMALAKVYSENVALRRQLDELNERYGDQVIEMSPGLFEGLEIQGVRDVHQAGDPTGSCIEVCSDKPQFYSVYAHYKPGVDLGGVECVGDFGTHELAVAYAEELSTRHDWRVFDFVPVQGRTPSAGVGLAASNPALRAISGQRSTAVRI
ncbi:hypothetical protein [Ralstonia pseudosolanacearum]|uniref:hypothetical protein n=1 Tax=Ralstonia pseudosolanacearum TaxID=1310165 RepID=UPI003CF658CA